MFFVKKTCLYERIIFIQNLNIFNTSNLNLIVIAMIKKSVFVAKKIISNANS